MQKKMHFERQRHDGAMCVHTLARGTLRVTVEVQRVTCAKCLKIMAERGIQVPAVQL